MHAAHALTFVAPRQVAIRTVALSAPGPGEVVVRALYSGISSGSELLAYRGEVDADLPLDETIGALGGTFSYPFRYGYSCVGVVEQGERLPAGTLVFAFHPHQDRFVASADELIPLPEVEPEVEPRRATLLPLVETALQISLDAGPVAHQPVLVFGLGAVGLLSAVLLQRAAARVVGVDPRADRRAAADAVGVEAVEPDAASDRAADLTSGRGVALAVEVSGVPAVLSAALDVLAHEGTALVGSWYGSKPVSLPLGAAFHRRRLVLRSTQVSTIPASQRGQWDVTRRRHVARRLLSELPLHVLATHTFPFAHAQEAFAAVDRGQEGVLHAALRYG